MMRFFNNGTPGGGRGPIISGPPPDSTKTLDRPRLRASPADGDSSPLDRPRYIAKRGSTFRLLVSFVTFTLPAYGLSAVSIPQEHCQSTFSPILSRQM